MGDKGEIAVEFLLHCWEDSNPLSDFFLVFLTERKGEFENSMKKKKREISF